MKKIICLVLCFIMFVCSVTVAEEIWTCVNCGTKNTGKFCGECGSANPSGSWKCSNCGTVNTTDFCTECGAKKQEEIIDENVSPLGNACNDTYINAFFGFKLVVSKRFTCLTMKQIAQSVGTSESNYQEKRDNYAQTLEAGQTIIDYYVKDSWGSSIKISIIKKVDGYTLNELINKMLPYYKQSLESMGLSNIEAQEKECLIAGIKTYGVIYNGYISGLKLYAQQSFMEKGKYYCMIDIVSSSGTVENGPNIETDNLFFPVSIQIITSDDKGQPLEELWTNRLTGIWKGSGSCFGSNQDYESYIFDTGNKELIFNFSSPANTVINHHNYTILDRNTLSIEGLRFEDDCPATLTWKDGFLELSFEDKSKNKSYYYLSKG